MPRFTGIFIFFQLAVICSPLFAQTLDSNLIAYVVLGEDGKQVARVLTPGERCPSIRIDGKEVQMNVRAEPESLLPRTTASVDLKPSVFPLLTCEEKIPANTRIIMVGNIPLPLLPTEVKRIVVIGDTGCRLKKSDGAYQACNDGNLYPFARIAAAAASWRPDLVVHVGDLLYRENACPDDHPGCKGSPWGYGWDAWQADFFTPGAALLKAAPWAMVRGNHESCSRAGQGWWRMIDTRPLLAGRDCNDVSNDDIGDYSDPYAVPLGSDAQLIVMDTSNTLEKSIPPGDIRQVKYRELYHKLERLTQQAAYNIVADHHPILGFSAIQDKRGMVTLQPGNQGIQSVFGAINPQFLPSGIDILLSGHVHAWQQISFSSSHPTQFVTGFSGTMEDSVALPAKMPPDTAPAPGAVVENLSSWTGGFGYMTMERKGQQQWEARVWDVNGKMRNTCMIDGSHSICDLAQIK